MTTPSPFVNLDDILAAPSAPGSLEAEPPPVLQGPLEAAVRADLDALALVSPTAGSMEQLAYNLARKLDDGAGMATAAVAKELRETLAAMAEEAGDDDGSALLERLSTPMPTQVGDTPPV